MQFALKINFTTINLRTVSDLRCIIQRSFQYLWIKCSPKCFTCHVIISSYIRFAYRISVFSLINLDSLTLCHTRIRPFKQRYFAGSAKCSTKLLSKLSTCTLSVVEIGLQSYCDSSHSRGGVNQMWILKNYIDLLEYIQSRSISSCNSIKAFDFSTL
jgi:hypothetical protein